MTLVRGACYVNSGRCELHTSRRLCRTEPAVSKPRQPANLGSWFTGQTELCTHLRRKGRFHPIWPLEWNKTPAWTLLRHGEPRPRAPTGAGVEECRAMRGQPRPRRSARHAGEKSRAIRGEPRPRAHADAPSRRKPRPESAKAVAPQNPRGKRDELLVSELVPGGYCRPSRASRTSVTASGKIVAITERSCSAC